MIFTCISFRIESVALIFDLLAIAHLHTSLCPSPSKSRWEFFVNSETLDPRPETELIIDTIKNSIKNTSTKSLKILDLGTGTGCIILTIYLELKKKKINMIMTAHNLEDQVETFFIRLSRGSGLTGLSAMKPLTNLNQNVKLYRPLLDIKKKFLVYMPLDEEKG